MDAVHYRMVQEGADFDIAQCVEHPDEYAAVRAAEPAFFLTAGGPDLAAARGLAAMKFYRLSKAGWNPHIDADSEKGTRCVRTLGERRERSR